MKEVTVIHRDRWLSSMNRIGGPTIDGPAKGYRQAAVENFVSALGRLHQIVQTEYGHHTPACVSGASSNGRGSALTVHGSNSRLLSALVLVSSYLILSCRFLMSLAA